MFLELCENASNLRRFRWYFWKLFLLTSLVIIPDGSNLVQAVPLENHTLSPTSSTNYYRRVSINSTNFRGAIVGIEMNFAQNFPEEMKIEEEKRKPLIAFRGIPYAKAPIGERRFQDPQPLDEFDGVLEALQDGYECPSITARNQSEDCLFLNVYTRNLPMETSTKLLPVLVVIHPGGLYLFSGASYMIGPGHFLRKDVVLVTFNYRLGSLGFLNLGTRTVPGNAGFKDQVYALRWIQQYIRYFGGDPDDITLMGYSAGALSVCLHLISPMSSPLPEIQRQHDGRRQPLFHKAIIMSGSVPPQVQLPQGEQRYLAHRQLKRLNCTLAQPRNDTAPNDAVDLENDYLQCLNAYDGIQISQTLRKMFIFGKDNPVYLWLPIIEQNLGQSERFLEDQDFYTLFRGLQKYSEPKIPLLIGYTDGEFCNSAVEILRNPQLRDTLRKDYLHLFPRIFMYQEDDANEQYRKDESSADPQLENNMKFEVANDEAMRNEENSKQTNIEEDVKEHEEKRRRRRNVEKDTFSAEKEESKDNEEINIGELNKNVGDNKSNDFMDHDTNIPGNRSREELDAITRQLIDRYFNGKLELNAEDHDNLCDLFSDAFVRSGSHLLADLAAERGFPVYVYEFAAKVPTANENSENSSEFPNKKDRVEHIVDFELLFKDNNNNSDLQGSSLIIKDRQKLADLYTDFMMDFIQNGKLSNSDALPYPKGYAVIQTDKIDYRNDGINFKNHDFWKQLFP